MFDTILTCKEAATEIRGVLGPFASKGPHVAAMLRDLDRCSGAATCPGHLRLDVIEATTEREVADSVEIRVLALLN